MKGRFYACVVTMSKILGPWVFVLVSWGIAAGYFLFFPRRAAVSRHFYSALFPNRNRLYYLWCSWKQYQNFTYLFLDRFLARDMDSISYTSEGWHQVEATIGTTGAVILMSHVGNWEVAAHFMKQQRPDIEFLLYMGIREKEQIERIQKDDLLESGIRIIAMDQEVKTSLDIVSGIQCIKSGGLVSMAGDKLWRKDQRAVAVEFLGHEVYLPEFPYVFALLSGAPLFVFFSFRTGRKRYHFTLSEPTYMGSPTRDQRKEAIQRLAQSYADLLQEAVCRNPFEWFHFEPFLGRSLRGALDAPNTSKGA